MAGHGKIQVVLNPVSGGAVSRQVLVELCHRMRRTGWRYSVLETRVEGDAAAAARQSCLEQARVLIVVGGDGTVSEAVGGMAGGGVPILVVPAGTENIVAKYLGLRPDADRLWQILECGGREVLFDVPSVNGRPFIIVAGAGFDAEVARRLVCRRRGHITHMSYFWPTWRTLWSYRFPEMHVEVDDERLYNGPGLAYVGNLGRYAGGLRILNRAMPDDGLLDVCVLQCHWQGPLLRHALNVFLRRHVGRPGVIYRQARRVRIWADVPVPLQVDGEAAGWLPAAFEMTPHPVRFLVPADWNQASCSDANG